MRLFSFQLGSFSRTRVTLFALLAFPLMGVCAEPGVESATQLFREKKFAEAEVAFHQIAEADPLNAGAHFYLGLLAHERKENEVAIQELERATQLDPRNSDYFTELGGAYGRAAKKAGLLDSLSLAQKCAAALEKAVALNPNNLVARNGLVSFYREAPPIAGGGKEKAYLQAEEIRKRDLAMGAAILGQLYVADRKFAEAFEVYEDVLTVRPDDYQTLYLIGRTASETGINLERGEQALRRCLELPPGPGEQGRAAVRWRLGKIAESRGDIAGARAAYEASLREHPGFQQAADSLAALK